MATNIGTGPEDIPLNQYLGDLAFQDTHATSFFRVLASDPATGVVGECYFNSSDSSVKVYDGSAWTSLSSAAPADGGAGGGSTSGSGNRSGGGGAGYYGGGGGGGYYDLTASGSGGGGGSGFISANWTSTVSQQGGLGPSSASDSGDANYVSGRGGSDQDGLVVLIYS